MNRRRLTLFTITAGNRSLGFFTDRGAIVSVTEASKIVPRGTALHRSFSIAILAREEGRTPSIPRGRITSCCETITSGRGELRRCERIFLSQKSGRHLVNPLRAVSGEEVPSCRNSVSSFLTTGVVHALWIACGRFGNIETLETFINNCTSAIV